AALLPNAGITLDRVIRRSVDRCPGLAFIVCSCNKGIPFAWKTVGLVVGSLVGAYEATSGASRASADCLSMHSVLDAVRCTNIHIADPRLSAVRADLNMNVTLRCTVRWHRLVVHITKIRRVIAIDCD